MNAERNELMPKLLKMIGTIHTFQEKQADIVILLLGGNKRKRGAIIWAAGKPNILNVAITRAKKLLNEVALKLRVYDTRCFLKNF